MDAELVPTVDIPFWLEVIAIVAGALAGLGDRDQRHVGEPGERDRLDAGSRRVRGPRDGGPRPRFEPAPNGLVHLGLRHGGSLLQCHSARRHRGSPVSTAIRASLAIRFHASMS